MATQAELVADLKESATRQKKTIAEIKTLQGTVDTLNSKVTDLEKIIAAGGTIGQELVDAVAEVKALSVQVDEQIPDVPELPPTP